MKLHVNFMLFCEMFFNSFYNFVKHPPLNSIENQTGADSKLNSSSVADLVLDSEVPPARRHALAR